MKRLVLLAMGVWLLGCTDGTGKAPFASDSTDREGDSGNHSTPSDDASSGTEPGRDSGADRDATSAVADASSSADASSPADSSVENDGGGDPLANELASGSITAAGGGEICLPSGLACLTFAPGALQADAVVTLRRVRYDSAAGGLAFRIEPETLTFVIAPEMRIDVSAIDPPVPYVTHGVTGLAPDSPPPTYRWSGVSRREGDWLRVDVPQPGFCLLQWYPVGVADGCAVRPAAFAACGGDLSGQWQLEGFCYGKAYSIVYEGWDLPDECRSLRTEVNQWPMDAQLQIGADTYRQTRATASIPLRTIFDLTCEYSPADNCTDLAPGIHFGLNDVSCTGDSLSCDCSFVVPSELPAIDASVSVDATTVSVDGGTARGYCVEGDRLQFLVNDGEPYVAVYRRVP